MSEAAETHSTLQKKKKTRFPISRIKKLIQQNEDVGKTTATVPVILSKCIEQFLTELLSKMTKVAEAQKSNKVQLNHFYEVVRGGEERYEFLKNVKNEPSVDGDDE